MNDELARNKTFSRVWIARGIAIGADVIQIALFPIFAAGILSPINDVLDVLVCIALTLLVGWHIAFAPSFIIKELPLADLAPTWTVAIVLATGGRRPSLRGTVSKLIGVHSASDGAQWQGWYDLLIKPRWTPSPRIISTIWTILYPVIFTTFGYLFVQAFRGAIFWHTMVPFEINLAANLLFAPLLFRLHRLRLALLDILLVVASLVWGMVLIWPTHSWIALALFPYLLWALVVAFLQFRIAQMNG